MRRAGGVPGSSVASVVAEWRHNGVREHDRRGSRAPRWPPKRPVAASGVDEVAVKALEGFYGRTDPKPTAEGIDALEAFIGCADSGDPDWATRDIHELRAEAAARKLAHGA